MLIQALCNYAEQHTNQIPDGWSEQPVSFEVLLTSEGKIGDILDIREQVEVPTKNGKKTKPVPRTCILPLRIQKSGIGSYLIEHRPLYLFGLNLEKTGFTTQDKTHKAQKSHAAFVKTNGAFFRDCDSEICQAYLKFIQNWNPEAETQNPHLLELGKLYTQNFCFGLQSNPNILLQEDSVFRQKYQAFYAAQQAEAQATQAEDCMQCSILGESLPIARIHDKIKFPGGNTTGCVLVGMKEASFESYGKTQSYNSGVSETAMKQYTSTLNFLLSDKLHRKSIDELNIIYFAMKKDDSRECDIFSALLGGDTSAEMEQDLNHLYQDTMKGITPNLSQYQIDEAVTFYVAGLSPNGSRICQKFLYRDRFGTFVENLMQHQNDLAINPERTRQVRFSEIRKELLSPNASSPKIALPLMTSILNAAFHGTLYPIELLATVIQRIRMDSDTESNAFIRLNDVRAGIIKAYLNRYARIYHQKEEITMGLNYDNTNPAYLCGRLFAVLEKIQKEAADGKLNRTIKDAYFSSACTVPQKIMPILCKLSQNHLKKLSTKKEKEKDYNSLKKWTQEIMDKLTDTFPATLGLPEQGSFILGYYQQMRAFYTKKETEESNN